MIDIHSHNIMLRVRTKLGHSTVNGIGVFADEFIRKGTITWQYDPEFDIAFDESAFERVPEHVCSQFLRYAYYDHDLKKYVLCSDDQRFINHSNSPNISSSPQQDRAARDIQPGEELTCDYAHYEHDWFERRGLRREHFT